MTHIRLALDPHAYSVLANATQKPSAYVSEVLRANWQKWHRALRRLRASGYGMPAIVSICEDMDNCWLLPNWQDVMSVSIPEELCDAFYIVAWEYWHGNEELRRALHTHCIKTSPASRRFRARQAEDVRVMVG